MDALPDARTASQVVATLLANASMSLSGSFTAVNDGVINPNMIAWTPGEIIQVGSNDQANPTLRRLEVGGDLQMGQIVLEDLRDSIRKAALDRGLPDKLQGTPISATEVMERMKDAQVDIGPAFSRITDEMAIPALQATVYALQQQQKIQGLRPIEPAAGGDAPMIRLDGSDLTVSFKSPLAQSQKLIDVSNRARAVGIVRETVGEAALQAAIDAPATAVGLLKLMGFPEDSYRDEEEAKALYQQLVQPQPETGTPGPMAPQAGPTGGMPA